MEGIGFILLGALIFFPIFYYIARAAVEEGTLKALIKFERIKSEKKI